MSANPYVEARRDWDERYADLVLGKRNWQIAAGGLLILSIMLAAGLIAERLLLGRRAGDLAAGNSRVTKGQYTANDYQRNYPCESPATTTLEPSLRPD
jgi:hypothetical protein